MVKIILTRHILSTKISKAIKRNFIAQTFLVCKKTGKKIKVIYIKNSKSNFYANKLYLFFTLAMEKKY